jgi:Methyltransferase domain
MDTQATEFWDEWWRARLSKDGSSDTFPLLPAPLLGGIDVANRDDLLVTVMAEYGLRTVLCAGNGVSQEPRALAAAGFEVTTLDISPVAVRFAEAFHDYPQRLNRFVHPQQHRPGGHVEFVVGDLLDITMCPGPFDVVIERRTVERFPQDKRGAALLALSGRLSKIGIFLSLCFDDNFPPEQGLSQHETRLFHASESWFREHGWTIWDGVPRSALAGRVAWLIRSGSG